MMVPGYKGPNTDMIARPAQPKMVSPGGPKLMPPQGGGFRGGITPPGPGNAPPRPFPGNTGPMKPPMAPPIAKPVPGGITPPGGGMPPMPGRGLGRPGQGPGAPGRPGVPPMQPPVAKPVPGGITPPGPGNAPRPMPRPGQPPMKPPVAKPLPRTATPPGPGNMPRGPVSAPPMPPMTTGGPDYGGPKQFEGGGWADSNGGYGGGGMAINPETGMAEAGGGGLYDQLMQRQMGGSQYGPQTGIGMGVPDWFQNNGNY